MMVHEELTQSSPHAEATEQELVQRVQAGDATAFDALFRRCCGKVFQHATRLLGNAAEAEEVVQEVFLAVYEKAQTFRGDAAFTTWLFRLTANASLSKLRRRKRSKEVAMEEYLPQFRPDGHHLVRPVVDWSANLEDRLADAQLQELLRQDIEILQPMEKAMLVLSDFEDWYNREIVDAIDHV